MKPILVAGTAAWSDDARCDWYCPGHPFGRFLADEGAPPQYDDETRPFVWSTDLAGVPLFTSKKDWSAGGAALAYFIRAQQLPADETALIVHSHGLQVAAMAAAEHNVKMRTLLSFGSPIREDMRVEYQALRSHALYWLHVHSDGSDRWQWLGELFDGDWRRWFTGGRALRVAPLADRNDFVPHVGHSELLRDPAQFHHWIERGWIDALLIRQEEAVL